MKMKAMKRFSSFVLALVMMLAMSVTALASEQTSGTSESLKGQGTITVNNAVEGQEYHVYKIFELESFDKTQGKEAYSYKVGAEWKPFLTNGAGKDYVTVGDQDYVTWKDDKKAEADMAAFAKAALTYAKDNKIAAITKTAESETVTFESLDLGYYLLDSNVGTMCSLNTAALNVTINDKNDQPNLDKKVENQKKEDADKWDEKNDVKIGDTVNYKVEITAGVGAQNYIMHDKMDEGLTFDPSSVVVKKGDSELTKDNEYSLVQTAKDGCTFEIVFAEEFCNGLKTNDMIIITYSAVLNKDAVIAGAGNKNEAYLKYGENNDLETTHKTTTTYTYEFDLVKTKSNNEVLTGAEFRLYGSQGGTDEILLVKEAGGDYRVATSEEKTDEFKGDVIEAGHVTIKGLDKGIYWLEETKAPDGYNKLAGRVEVQIKQAATVDDEANEDPYVVENMKATVTDGTWTAGGIKVINQTGAELPSTGGIGTTIFYVVGGILVVAAIVLLVTKRRMSNRA